MSNSPNIVIIGAGLIGLSTADSLSAHGANVTVIEKEKGPALGASYSNSGMLHSSQSMPWNWSDLTEDQFNIATCSVLALARTSKRLIKKNMSDWGLPDRHRADGCLQLFDNEYTGRKYKTLYDKFGILNEVSGSHVWSFNRYAVLFPDDSSGDAYTYCKALTKQLKARGVDFHFGADVKQINISDGRACGVTLAGVKIVADEVIVAAGSSSHELLSQIGITIPLYNEKGFAIDFEKPEIELPSFPIMHIDSHSTLTVFSDKVRLSGTTKQSNHMPLLKTWEKIAPNLVGHLVDQQRIWSNYRPMSQMGHPFIGHTGIDHLWINTGHGHMGWTLCAGSGQILANIIFNVQKDLRFQLKPMIDK